MLDNDLIQRKLALIHDDLQYLVRFEHLKLEELAKDVMTQAVVERLLERIIGRALDINQHIIAECGGHLPRVATYHDTFLRLSELEIYPEGFAKAIARSAGLRNVLVHDYNTIEPELLHKSVGEAIQEFNEYSKYILSFVDRVQR